MEKTQTNSKYKEIKSFFPCDNKTFVFLLVGFVIVIKILCIFSTSCFCDTMAYHLHWLDLIQNNGLFSIYQNTADYSVNYPPLFPVLLSLFSLPAKFFYDINCFPLFHFFIKLPIVLISSFFSFYLYKNINKGFGLFWFCNPVFIIDSELWGQTDTLLCIAIVLFSINILKKNYFTTTIWFTIGCLLKLQMCYLAPIFLIFLLKSKSIRTILKNIFLGATLGIAGWLPFIIANKNILLPFNIYLSGFSSFPDLQLNSNNLYAITGDMKCSDISLMGISGESINTIILVAIIVLFSILFYYTHNELLIIGSYLYSIFFFTFSQHERYSIPFISVFALYYFIVDKKIWKFLICNILGTSCCILYSLIGNNIYFININSSTNLTMPILGSYLWIISIMLSFISLVFFISYYFRNKKMFVSFSIPKQIPVHR